MIIDHNIMIPNIINDNNNLLFQNRRRNPEVKNIIIKKYLTYFINFINQLNTNIIIPPNNNFYVNLPDYLITGVTAHDLESNLQTLNYETYYIIDNLDYHYVSNDNKVIISREIYNIFIKLIGTICIYVNNFNIIKNLFDNIFWAVDNWDDDDNALVYYFLTLNQILDLNIRRYPNLRRNICRRSREHECVICLSDIVIDETQVVLSCNHYFHEECIITWLDRNNSCPVCRNNII